jgi:molecular chaperone HscC
LGGEDFNQKLMENFFRAHRESFSDLERSSAELRERVRDQAERARRSLTTQQSATMAVIWKGKPFEHVVDSGQFEVLAAPLIERLRDPVMRALRDGGIQSDRLEEIVLVGGATRMPVVRRSVAKMFGRFPGKGPDPDEAVALGAAVQAGLKARDSALKEFVMTDVCPFTLGVDISERRSDGSFRDGLFAPIIERNTVVPTSRMKTFSTLEPGQRKVRFNIYQGESPLVADNIALGAIEIPVASDAGEQVAVEVRFTYDINGLLEVDVKVPHTRETRQLTLIGQDINMTTAELDAQRRKLAALKFHPRDLDANRAALARAVRCYEQVLGDERTQVQGLISEFESLLDRQDPREIEAGRSRFLNALNAIEGDSFL